MACFRALILAPLSGATTNNSIVNGVVPSFVEQVIVFQQFFVPINATATVEVPWIPATTLFGEFNRNHSSID